MYFKRKIWTVEYVQSRHEMLSEHMLPPRPHCGQLANYQQARGWGKKPNGGVMVFSADMSTSNHHHHHHHHHHPWMVGVQM